ncbi:MAG: NAD-dependent epimerase/dehydratase [Chitinophagaceae bacterium]|nr:NAD-dependent epimerase/dehydratase [Chitinophagaceae bacterium]
MGSVLIFGHNGQDGFYLSQFLSKMKVRSVGISRTSTKNGIIGDIADTDFVKRTIHKYKPTYIFHFAANSTIAHDAILENEKAINIGTVNILEGTKEFSPKTKVFIAGSALQFKNQNLPINELCNFDYSNPYSIARNHSTFLTRYYRDKFGIKIYYGFLFNHDSALRSSKHINQKVIHFVNNLQSNQQTSKLLINNLHYKKEFNFAGDIVKAIWMFVNQDKTFEMVIGSGIAYAIKDWVDYCFKSVKLNWEDYVVQDIHSTGREAILVSDPATLFGLGWKPEIDFYRLADLMLANKLF